VKILSADSLIDQYRKNRANYEKFTSKISSLLTELLQANNQVYCSIDSRTKEIDSLENKIVRKQGKYKKLTDITDLSGIRIITYYSEDVDRIEELIKKEFVVDEKNTIDKRKSIDPDRFGYLSLHYVVSLDEDRVRMTEHKRFKDYKVEIQIRTILQHAWAAIEHDLGYKAKDSIPREVTRDFSRLAGLLELADKEFSSIRHALNDYDAFVHKEIENKDAEILIDDVSIKAFLGTNADIKKLNECIAEEKGYTLQDCSQFDISHTTRCVKWVGFKTIHDIKIKLKETFPLALYITKKYIRDANDEKPWLAKNIGLFYLCYCELISERSPERIISYWKANNIHDDNQTESAQRLVSLYDEYCTSQVIA
jgi:ppGpp synthetase/RelA/SpoT-type nucleotidyltranferase